MFFFPPSCTLNSTHSHHWNPCARRAAAPRFDTLLVRCVRADDDDEIHRKITIILVLAESLMARIGWCIFKWSGREENETFENLCVHILAAYSAYELESLMRFGSPLKVWCAAARFGLCVRARAFNVVFVSANEIERVKKKRGVDDNWFRQWIRSQFILCLSTERTLWARSHFYASTKRIVIRCRPAERSASGGLQMKTFLSGRCFVRCLIRMTCEFDSNMETENIPLYNSIEPTKC